MKGEKILGAVVLGVLLASLSACGGADAPVIKSVSTAGYTITSEKTDPATGADVIDIKVPQPDEVMVKSAVESLINTRKARYPSITVNTYVESVAASEMPYCVSKLESGVVSHQFNPQAAQQRIPPH